MIEFPFGTSENGESEPDTLPADPAMSAYNEHEAGRLDRLRGAWGFACAAVRLQSHRYQRHWDGAILELRDHKGTLEVTWRDRESRMMFEGVIMGAWEAHAEHMGEHILVKP